MEKHSRFLFFFCFSAKKVRINAPRFILSRLRDQQRRRLRIAAIPTARFQNPFSNLFP